MDVERALRALRNDDRLDLPIAPDAVQAVHRGVRRRRRRNAVLSAAGSAVLIAAGLSSAAVITRGGPAVVRPGLDEPPPTAPPVIENPGPLTGATPDNEIGWNPIPYDETKPFALPETTPDPSVPWCDPKTVTVSATQFQGATGSAAGSLILTNDGEPCAVQGPPSVTAYAGDAPVAATADADAFLVHPWLVLDSGRSARSIVQISGDSSRCLGPVTRLEVDLGYGGDPVSTDIAGMENGDVQPRCGSVPKHQQADHYFALALPWTRPNGATALPMSDLTVSIVEQPPSVMQGTTIRYQVMLSISHTAVDPCLPFREQLLSTDGTSTAYASQYYLLDCTAMGRLDTTRYRLDMELTLPKDVPPGDYLLDWRTPIPDVTPESSPTIKVTPAPPPCEQKQLDLTRGRAGVATAGSYLDRVLITNVSARTCSLRGHPGVEFVDPRGRPLPTHPTWDDARPYETVVLTAHGGSASFVVGGAVAPAAGAQTCQATKGLRVIAPNLAEQVFVPGVGRDCADGDIRVFAVVAGPHAMP